MSNIVPINCHCLRMPIRFDMQNFRIYTELFLEKLIAILKMSNIVQIPLDIYMLMHYTILNGRMCPR